MSYYLNEDEQVELLKRFWNKYWKYIIASILFVPSSIWLYKWYSEKLNSAAIQTSIFYDDVIEGLRKNDESDIQAASNRLIQDFGTTVYADLTRLIMSKRAIDQNKFDDALNYLKSIYEHSSYSSIKDIAAIRAARIYVFQQKADMALSLLNKISTPSFNQMVQFIKGDILYQQNDLEGAKRAYNMAIADNGHLQALILLKAQDLGLLDKDFLQSQINIKQEKP